MSSISLPTTWSSPWMSHDLQPLLPHHHCPHPTPYPKSCHLLVSQISISSLLLRGGPCLLALLKSRVMAPAPGSFVPWLLLSSPAPPLVIFSSNSPSLPSAPASLFPSLPCSSGSHSATLGAKAWVPWLHRSHPQPTVGTTVPFGPA